MTRTERRLAERFGLKIPLRVRIAKSAALEHTAESLNVSTRGISFATDLPLYKGALVSPRPNGGVRVMWSMSSRTVLRRVRLVWAWGLIAMRFCNCPALSEQVSQLK